MTDNDLPAQGLAPLLDRFAAESARIEQLVLVDEDFRDIAEDFPPAHKTLRSLKGQPIVDQAKATEYIDLVRQLEHDVRRHLPRSNQELG